MFSEVQREYIKQFVLSNKAEYPYYLAYSNPYIGNGYSSDDPDFYIILSPEEITATSLYNYSVPPGAVRYGVRSGNASYNYHAARLTSATAPTSLIVNDYAFVYTNATSSASTVQPDVLATPQLSQSAFNGFGIALLIVLLSVIVFRFVRR